jgi:uncharacterized protein
MELGGALGEEAGRVHVEETHISLLIFTDDRVYKLRKPVKFDFLDFSDPESRRADCEREVRLNRRLAPDVYLGVAAIVLGDQVLDHMVVMRALPVERRLDTLATGGDELSPCMRHAARLLATFHAGADRSLEIDQAGTAESLRQEWETNFAEMDRFVGPVLSVAADSAIRARVWRWLERHADLLQSRIASGCVCDGHGDLQASDTFCLDDGVRILDCIEFSDRLRHGDVCNDIAFLYMDLQRLGRPDAAEEFVSSYEKASRARLPRHLLHFYAARCAYVRARVLCIRLDEGLDNDARVAQALHQCALQHLWLARHALILVGGLPGSGKSTLARALSAETGWALLQSDAIRQELAPLADSPAGSGHEPWTGRYAAEMISEVYDDLLRRARERLDRGESVILDASWILEAQRRAARRVATDHGAELVEFCCTCEPSVAAARIEDRQQAEAELSEATAAVRSAMSARAEPWPEAKVVDTSGRTSAETFSEVLRLLEELETGGPLRGSAGFGDVFP